MRVFSRLFSVGLRPTTTKKWFSTENFAKLRGIMEEFKGKLGQKQNLKQLMESSLRQTDALPLP